MSSRALTDGWQEGHGVHPYTPILLTHKPSVLLIDLWKTLARSTYPEPITDLQIILRYKTVLTDSGLKTDSHPRPDPEFLRVCLTTPDEDPDLYMAKIAAHFGLRIPEGASEQFRRLIENEKHGLSLFLDVQAELMILKQQGYKLGLLSNVWPFPVRHLLERSGLDGVFDELILSCEVGVAKPDPGIFTHAARLFGVEPSDCLMIGDNVDLDVVGALAANMPAVHIDRYGDSERFVPGVPVISELRQLYSHKNS